MNPSKTEEDLFLHHLGPPSPPRPPPQIVAHHHHDHEQHQTQSQPSIPNAHDDPPFSLPEIVIFRSSSSSSSPCHSEDENDDVSTHLPPNPNPNSSILSTNNDHNQNQNPQPLFISPEPHISSQFYTFNPESHSLMIRCLLDRRLATPPEIRAATPRAVLKSWRAVWKDRNEDTAYLTAWKRIQDKLSAHVDQNGHVQFHVQLSLWTCKIYGALRS